MVDININIKFSTSQWNMHIKIHILVPLFYESDEERQAAECKVSI